MNILIHSSAGDGFALGHRFQDAGHDVLLYILHEKARPVGEGIIEKCDEFMAEIDWADLILFDMVGHGALATKLQHEGYPVFGAHEFCDLIELDRLGGMRLFAAMGLAIPETHEFPDADFDRASDLVEQDGGRWVFKGAGNIGTDKTHVAIDAEDMLAFLERMDETIEATEGKRPPFIMQRFIDGIEISTERWYANGKPIYPFDNITFEEKKFLVGNLGPTVGCAGNIVIPLITDQRWLAQTVDRLDRAAAHFGLTGPVDLNAIVDDQGTAFILEATARFGYDALWAFLMLFPDTDLAELFRGFTVPGSLVPVPDHAVAAAVRVSLAPYPGGDAREVKGECIADPVLTDPHLWPGDVMLDKDGKTVVAGADGVIYIAADTGPTIARATKSIYRRLHDSRQDSRQYRTDIGERAIEALGQLHDLGYFQHARYAARG